MNENSFSMVDPVGTPWEEDAENIADAMAAEENGKYDIHDYLEDMLDYEDSQDWPDDSDVPDPEPHSIDDPTYFSTRRDN